MCGAVLLSSVQASFFSRRRRSKGEFSSAISIFFLGACNCVLCDDYTDLHSAGQEAGMVGGADVGDVAVVVVVVEVETHVGFLCFVVVVVRMDVFR